MGLSLLLPTLAVQRDWRETASFWVQRECTHQCLVPHRLWGYCWSEWMRQARGTTESAQNAQIALPKLPLCMWTVSTLPSCLLGDAFWAYNELLCFICLHCHHCCFLRWGPRKAVTVNLTKISQITWKTSSTVIYLTFLVLTKVQTAGHLVPFCLQVLIPFRGQKRTEQSSVPACIRGFA